MKKIVLIIVAIVLIFASIGAIVVAKMKKAVKNVETEQPAIRTIESTVIAFGKIEPKSDVNISAEVSEKIIKLYVEAGDTVRLGDTLVILNGDRYRALLNQAEAALAQNMANASKSRQYLDKAEQLFKTGAVSEDNVIEARTQVEIYDAMVKSADASVKEARQNLSHTIIRSPLDGIVTVVQAEQGEFVIVGTMNNPGSAILKIAQLSDMQAKVSVDEADVVDLILGQHAKLELDALSGKTFEGRVVQIAHEALIQNVGGDETRASFEVKIALIDTSAKIRPGMSITATITTATRDSALSIPLSAVVSYSDSSLKEAEGVFLVEDGRAKKVKIETGISDDRFIEVKSGLTVDQKIITGPFKVLRELKDGDKVTMISQTNSFGKFGTFNLKNTGDTKQNSSSKADTTAAAKTDSAKTTTTDTSKATSNKGNK